jgi:hypothetical protein
MSLEHVGYALLCVIVPVAWGLVIYGASNRIEARLQGGQKKNGEAPAEPPPLDYHI